MKKILILLFLSSCFLLLSTYSFAQIPAKPQSKSILLLNGIAHLGNGQVIQKSAIGFKDGKINLVTDSSTTIDRTAYDEIIDINGKHIYPGFIAPNSTIGLREIDAVRATLDYQETGSMNPNVRSIIAYNAESKIIPTIRSNGVLLAQVAPRYGMIPGTSSIVELDGWNWEDALYKTDDGIHVNLPKVFSSTGWWAEPGITEKNKQKEQQFSELKTFFINAKAYCEVADHTEKNIKMEAMRGVFDGTKTLFINANYVKEIIEAVNLARALEIKKTVIIGGDDSWMVTDMLIENKVAVILNRLHELPGKPEDDVDLSFKRPFLLQKAGVLYCLGHEGDMEVMGTRNLPFNAGTAAAYGLNKEEALMAITSNTAKILGIDARVGTLETGKDATFFVSTGDALDMRTNNVEIAFIRGKLIDLDDHQKQLYKKFSNKYK